MEGHLKMGVLRKGFSLGEVQAPRTVSILSDVKPKDRARLMKSDPLKVPIEHDLTIQ